MKVNDSDELVKFVNDLNSNSNLNIIVTIRDCLGRFTYVSDSFLDVCDLDSTNKIYGKKIEDTVFAQYSSSMREIDNDAKNGKLGSIDKIYLDKNNRYKILRGQFSLFDGSKILGIYQSIYHPVTKLLYAYDPVKDHFITSQGIRLTRDELTCLYNYLKGNATMKSVCFCRLMGQTLYLIP